MEIILFIIIGLVLSTYFIIKRGPKVTIYDVVRKGLASAFFVFVGLTVFGIQHNTTTAFCLCALIAGFIGDIVLDYQYCCKQKESKVYLLTGFGAFSIGHFSYVASMYFSRPDWYSPVIFKWYYPVAATAIAAIVALGVTFLEKPMKMNYGKIKPIVAVYSGIVTLPMTVSALNAINNSGDILSIALFIGFLLFLISDVILCGVYFGNKNNKKNIAACHILYYLAQYLIAFIVSTECLI